MKIPQFKVAAEQIVYTQKIVQHSLENHSASNIWADGGKTYHYRLTGTLGEVIFADLYDLPRPKLAFGAVGGQDFGRDFVLAGGRNIDVKTSMQRTPTLKDEHGVLIKKMQINDVKNQTDIYYFLRLYAVGWDLFCMAFGTLLASDVKAGRVGKLKLNGEITQRGNGAVWVNDNDCFDIKISELTAIKPNKKMESLGDYKLLTL